MSATAEAWLAELRATWQRRPTEPEPRWNEPRGAERYEEIPNLAWLRDVYAEGVVTWGWVVVAFGEAWDAGQGTIPGIVLWSADPTLEAEPAALELIAQRYWLLRREGRDLPGLRRVEPWTRAEAAPDSRQRLPPLLGDGRVVWVDPLHIRRGHLPHGRLGSSIVPVVRFPRVQRQGVAILPFWFWPPTYRATWSADRPSG